ncbi:MAG TPA: hypothetical protein PK529_00345 [Verrucomicrobiales bacterium]|nr:hypothetical protein [Verrucomicrobiales bacterium]
MVRLLAGDGQKGDGPDSPDPISCRMARPHGVGIDPVTGDLYIGDSETHKVRKLGGLPGREVATLADFATEAFELEGRKCLLTRPKKVATGSPWIWRTRFYGAFPAVDEALLAHGWHVAYIETSDQFGGPAAMAELDAFYKMMTTDRGLRAQAVMEGFSRGGLSAMNWSIANPGKVLGIYIDAPVLDIHSWPKPGSPELWKECLVNYGLTEETSHSWKGPLTRLEVLAKAKIPIMVVAGGADTVVPFSENGGILEARYRALGGELAVIVKAATGLHPHSLHDPGPVVAWAKRLIAK